MDGETAGPGPEELKTGDSKIEAERSDREGKEGPSINVEVKEERLKFIKEGPKLADLLSDGSPRDNKISSTNNFEYPKVPRSFTEREGLEDLSRFIDTTAQAAEQKGDSKMAETASKFRENLVYVGEKEMSEAAGFFANRVMESARGGENIFLFAAQKRSESYVSLRLLEEVDRLTADQPELQGRIHFSDNDSKIASMIRQIGGKSRVILPDDFSISGTQIDQTAGRIVNNLIRHGFSAEQAAGMVELDLIADKLASESGASRHVLRVGPVGGEKSLPINAVSYFTVPEYKREDGSWVVYPGVSVTGSHASSDYGFESAVEDFSRFLQQNGGVVKVPLLYNVNRDYETAHGEFIDKDFQSRWNKATSQYKL